MLKVLGDDREAEARDGTIQAVPAIGNLIELGVRHAWTIILNLDHRSTVPSSPIFGVVPVARAIEKRIALTTAFGPSQ